MHKPPDFFIVGQPKTGTTALHEMLRQHPEIYMPEVKEPQYFASELADVAPLANLPTNIGQYLALFEQATPNQRTGEASALYLWSPTAARHIAQTQPNARIIALLREPASFLRSLHLHFIRTRVEDQLDLRTALALEDARRVGKSLPRGGNSPQLLIYSEHMCYMDQLHRYATFFPAAQVLILFYDDFRRNNLPVVRQILKFLDVDDTVSLPSVELNTSVRLRASRSRRVEVLMERASEGRGPVSSTFKTAVEAVTTQRLRRAAQRAVRSRLVYAKPRTPDEDLMLELRRRYRPEVEALSDYLGRDLITLWDYQNIEHSSQGICSPS